MRTNQQNYPSLKAALNSVNGFEIVDIRGLEAADSKEKLASYIQGTLQKPTGFLIPWEWMPVAEMALFNAPLSSSEVVFILEPIQPKWLFKTAAVMSREPS